MKKKKQLENDEKAGRAGETPKLDELALANRDVYIFGRLDNDVAMPVIRRLLRLCERDSKKDINVYINSSGGNGYNADAIIAIIHSIEPRVNTICLGHALSGACEILAAGTGLRSAYEFATLMFHQTIWEAEGDITNLEIQALQGQRFRQAQIELLHRSTGQDRERLRKDIERDFYLSAKEALDYGIIDSIIEHHPRKKVAHIDTARTREKPKSRAVAVKPVAAKAQTGTASKRTTSSSKTKPGSTKAGTTKPKTAKKK